MGARTAAEGLRVHGAKTRCYADRLRLLADLTFRAGATPIFVSQPTRHYRITRVGSRRVDATPYDHLSVNGIDVYHVMRKLDGVARSVATEKGAIYVDLQAAMSGWTWISTISCT